MLSSARRCPPRRPGLPLAGIACFFLAFGAASSALAAGQVVYVNGSSGNDANDCLAASRACRTIQRGANVVRGGDRMVVSAGVYYETPTFTNLGSSAASPVWIASEIPGGATISGMWKEAALGQVSWRDDGGGVFSAAHGPALFGSYNRTYLFRFLSVTDLRAARVSAGGTMINTPAHGFAYEGGRLFVRLPGGVSPNGRSVLFSSPTWGETGTSVVVRVTGSPYVILDGFRIEGSGTFCAGFGAESTFPTVRNTILEYCRYGLQLPNNSLVEWTEYTYPGFRDFAEAVRVANANTMRVYDLMKVYHPGSIEGGLADTYGPSGTAYNAEFRYNYLHQTFDGESLGDFEDSESHHNVYDSNYDDHVEMESWSDRPARNLRLHDSLFLSVGLISHQSETMVGPQYVYRNVVYSNDVHGASKWTIIKSKAPNATGGIFYYHNVLWGQTSELFWEEESRAHLHFRNNLLVFQENYNSQTATPLDSNYNLLVNNISKPFLFGPNGAYVGANPASVGFLDVSGLNFGISGASPAVNRGVPLPGFNDGAPGGPDVGAFEAGVNPGTEWPRPRRTAYTPFPPERWNGALPPGAPTNVRVIR